jgi:hypothetical protein
MNDELTNLNTCRHCLRAAVIALWLLLFALPADIADGQGTSSEQEKLVTEVLKSLGLPDPVVQNGNLTLIAPAKFSPGTPQTRVHILVSSGCNQVCGEEYARDQIGRNVISLGRTAERSEVSFETPVESLTLRGNLPAFMSLNSPPRLFVSSSSNTRFPAGAAVIMFPCGNLTVDVMHLVTSAKELQTFATVDEFDAVGLKLRPEAKTAVVDWAQKLADALQAHGACSSSPYQLKIERIHTFQSQPFDYQPLAYSLTLKRQGADGKFTPASNEIIRVPNPWIDFVPIILSVFQASDCTNCEWMDFEGTRFAHTTGGLDDIYLKVDANGEATLTLYLNLLRLLDVQRLPSTPSPLTKTIRALYESGSGAGKKTLAEVSADAKIESIGIVEKILYTHPTIWDPVTDVERPDSQRAMELSLLSKEDGDDGWQVDYWILRAAERVRLFPDGKSYLSSAGSPAPGEVLKPGDFVGLGDSIFITACSLPDSNRLQDGNPVGQPSNIVVQVRFFDGVRAQVIIDSRDCSEPIQMGAFADQIIDSSRPMRERAWIYAKELSESFLKKKTKGQVKEALKMIAKRYVPLITAIDTVSKIGGYIETLKSALGFKPVYVRLNSSVLIESDATGNLRVTTREGTPMVFTETTGDKGIPVPAGQTAIIPESMLPQVINTDAETAKSADALLSQLVDKPIAKAPSSPAGNLPQFANLMTGGAIAIVCVIVLGLIGIFGIVKRRPRSGAPARPPTYVQIAPSVPPSRPGPSEAPMRNRSGRPPDQPPFLPGGQPTVPPPSDRPPFLPGGQPLEPTSSDRPTFLPGGRPLGGAARTEGPHEALPSIQPPDLPDSNAPLRPPHLPK